MFRFSIIIVIIAFLNSCGTIDPEGIWQMDKDKSYYYLVLKTETGIAVRKPEMKTWINIEQKGEQRFVNKGPGEIFQFKDGDILELQDKNGKAQASFKKVILKEIDPKVITKGMTKEQVKKFIGNPEKKFKEGSFDNWVYGNDFLLAFDNSGAARINTNYKSDRNFDQITKGMSRAQVVEIVGNPDETGLWNQSRFGFQKWFYGSNTVIYLDNEKVLEVDTAYDPNQPDPSELDYPVEQSYSIKDLHNDRPAAFVVDEELVEMLECKCSVGENQPTIELSGQKGKLNINLKPDQKFTATRSYTLDGANTVSGPANEVDLSISSSRHEKGVVIIGFIRWSEDCVVDKKGTQSPCNFKGTFSCIFQ